MTIKKVAKSIMLCLALLFLLTGAGLVPVYAETTSQDGFEVILETNKEEYASNEQIDVTLTVTNNNDFSVANLSLENQIPDGYKLVNDTVASKQMESLAAGEKVSLVSSIAPNKSSGGSDNNKQNSDKTTTITDDKNNGNNPTNTKTSAKTSTETNSKKEKNKSFSIVDTGDESKMYFWIGLLVIGIVGTSVFVAIKYKNSRKAMLMLLSIATAGVAIKATTIDLNAEETQDKSVSIVKTIKVDGKNLALNSKVKYQLSASTDEENVNEYYKENSEIIEIIDAESDTNLLSESEAISLLESKGFEGLEVNYDCLVDGTQLDETEALSTSSIKHPMYTAYYISSNDEFWTIYIIESHIIAYPVSFNLVSNFESELLVSESNEIISYESDKNQFYLTLPKSSGAIVKIVEKINKKTLDSLTAEELAK